MSVRPLLLTTSLLTALASLPANAVPLEQQRRLYDTASAALQRNDPQPYLQYRSALQDYPLEPYLAEDELTLRLENASNAEVERFLAEHGDLPQIDTLRLRWLRLVAGRDDWQTFLRHYRPELEQAELDCLHASYLIRSGQGAAGVQKLRQLWLTGKSLPSACDPLFDQLQTSGNLGIEMLWQRFKLAAEAKNDGLARALIQRMQPQFPQFAAAGERMLDVLARPAQLENVQQFAQPYTTNADTVLLGLRRMAKEDPGRAIALLDEYSRYLRFEEADRVAAAREIGMVLARRFDMRALQVMGRYDPQLRDDTLSEWRGRLLLRNGNWQEASQLTRQMPQSLANTPRWRYWSIRSQQLTQPNAQVQPMYASLARERDFYGFLAADQIAAPYQLNHRPLPVDSRMVEQVRNTPAVRRAVELQARGQTGDARREWLNAARHFSREQLLAQARLGYQMGWYLPAIRTLGQAQYLDDLDVRFPMAYQNSLVSASRNRNIHSSWAFAITRQESVFMTDARSGSGAMGLMQLMPGTATETARRYGIPLASPQQAYDAETNIQLGTAYLSQMYGQFGSNRILASAAYNAGPGNVRKWLNVTSHLPYDIWIESIPFDETRQYVQNVLSYSVIYGQKLGAPQRLVEPHEKDIDQSNNR